MKLINTLSSIKFFFTLSALMLTAFLIGGVIPQGESPQAYQEMFGRAGGAWGKIWKMITGAEQEGLAFMRPYGLWVQGGRIFVADTERASVVILRPPDIAPLEFVRFSAQFGVATV